MERRFSNVPAVTTCCDGVTLTGQDTAFGYDAYGNQTTVTTYAGLGTYFNGSISAPGGGSTGRTTTTAYDHDL